MRTPSDMPRRPTTASTASAFGTEVLVPILSVVGSLVLVAAIVVLDGLIVRYGWDVVVIHTFLSAPHISLAQAIGLSTFVTFATSHVVSDKDLGKAIKHHVMSTAVFLATVWILHLYIPGA